MENDEIMTGDMLVETVENQLAEGNPVKVKETPNASGDDGHAKR